MDDATRPLAFWTRERVLPVSPASRFAWREHLEQAAGRTPPSFMVFGVPKFVNNAENRGCAGMASALCRRSRQDVDRARQFLDVAHAAAHLALVSGTFRVPLMFRIR